jgi:hypothetical protein
MSLNQLVDPLHPLDITVHDLTVEGTVDIGSIALDDVLITGTTTFTDVTPSTALYLSSGGILSGATLGNGQLLIGDTGSEPVPSTLTAGSGVSITNGAGTITVGVDTSNIVLVDSKQSITGAKAFTTATEFKRLVSSTGNNNVLLTGSPNINANSGNAVIIGGESDDQKDYSGTTLVGAAIAVGVPNIAQSVLLGSLILVDNNSSNNVIIGTNMAVSGSNQVVIGNSTTTSFYSLGTNASLGTVSHPWNSAAIRNDLTLGAQGNLVFTSTDSLGSQSFFHAGFTGDKGIFIPDLNGNLMINDFGAVTQTTSPVTSVTFDATTTLIVTQPFNTAALSSTSFTFFNTFASPTSMISISSYSGSIGSQGNPSVLITGFTSGVSMVITIINNHPVNALSGFFGITVMLL